MSDSVISRESERLSQENDKTELVEPRTWGIKGRHNTFGTRGRTLSTLVTITAVTGFSLFGYDQGLMSGIITGVKFNEEFPGTAGSSTHATVVQGAITSCYELGCFFGALFAMFKGEQTGRRPLMIVGSIIIIIGTVISVSSFKDSWGTGQFVIGRVITGIGNGLNTCTIPVWQSEMSKPENRGRLVNLEGSVVAVGTFVAYWLDFGFSYINSSVQWRFPISLQILFALGLFVGILGLPESPRWLIARGRISEARHVLGALKDLDADDDEIVAESLLIQDAVNRFDNAQLGLKEIMNGGQHQYYQRMIIGASTQFFQQFTGCNAAIYYSTVLFENTIGLSRRLSLILGGVFATIYALSTIPSFFLIDTLGRRPLFLIGATGQAVSFTISFACLVDDTQENAKGAAFGIFLFIVFFGMSILGLPWIYPPEINPLRSRTFGTSVSTCTNWICNFAVVMFTPVFINKSGWGCYLFFAVLNWLFIPVIYFFYPETAGRSLEEIDIIFAKAYVEKAAPFKVAQSMPRLTNKEVEEEGTKLGLYDGDDLKPSNEFNEPSGFFEKNESASNASNGSEQV